MAGGGKAQSGLVNSLSIFVPFSDGSLLSSKAVVSGPVCASLPPTPALPTSPPVPEFNPSEVRFGRSSLIIRYVRQRFNTFTAMLEVPSLGKRPIKVPNLKFMMIAYIALFSALEQSHYARV